MKIVAPASSLEDVKNYLEVGVDEIYFGLNVPVNSDSLDKKWDSVNERFEKHASLSSVEDVKKVYDLNRNSKNPAELSFVLNRAFFNSSQFEAAKKQIRETKSYVDNYIISDPSLIEYIKKSAVDKNIILSCLTVCMNSDSVKFFKNLGVKKIILPRHLTIAEIENLAKNNPDMEFEVIILNQFCRNIDGFCFRCHIPQGAEFKPICNLESNYKAFNVGNISEDKINKMLNNIANINNKFNPFCGICFIKGFRDAGVNSLKIVGREYPSGRKIEDLKFLKKAISNLDSEKEYETSCQKLFYERYKVDCRNNCYY